MRKKDMNEENFSIPKKEGKVFDPVPDDKYSCEFLEVKAEKRPTYNTRFMPPEQQELEYVLNFQFTILNSGEFRGRNLWANFVPAALYVGKKGKNTLYQILEALTGNDLSPELEATLDLSTIKTLIGTQINVFTAIIVKGDKKYNNIIRFMPCVSKLTALTAEEKETARVKPKEATATPASVKEPQVAPDNSDPSLSEIPF